MFLINKESNLKRILFPYTNSNSDLGTFGIGMLFLIITLLSFSCQLSSENAPSKNDKRANIILVLADDMGYSDLGCYGGEISTPNLDELSNEGLMFTQFYNGARCCPTQASLSTGICAHLEGMGEMIRYDRMKEKGVIDKNQELSPLDEDSAKWENLSEAAKDSMDLKMSIYSAMIDVIDQQIGWVINKLKATGELDNTFILFLSDNGASYEFDPLSLDFLPDFKEKLGGEDSFQSYGKSWANASNTPYKKFKTYTYEGRVVTPCIVRWDII